MSKKADKNYGGLIAELKRRNVFRVGAFYLVTAWLVLQVASIVLPALSMSAGSLRLVLIVLTLGFPVALLLAWIYELTPKGLKLESEVDPGASIAHLTGRRLDFLIIAILLVAVLTLLLDKFVLSREHSVTDAPSIAVLPFINTSGNAETAAFSDGLAETLLHRLAQVEGLHVAARTSSFQFREQSGSVAEIASQLNVNKLLEGSVQQWGDQVSVTAKLIDAKNGFQLWSGNYKHEKLTDIFRIQEDIAAHVTQSLELTLMGDAAEYDKYGTSNVKAYEAFLRGRAEQVRFSFESLPKAEVHYLEAIKLDPKYARAYLDLAETYLDMRDTGIISVDEALSRVEQPLEAATSLLGQSPGVLAVAGRVATMRISKGTKGAEVEAETAFLQALQKDPDNVKALRHYAQLLYNQLGRPMEAVQYAKRGLIIDPRSDRLLSVYGSALRDIGETELALEQYRKMREFYPDSPFGYYLPAYAYARVGRYVESVMALRDAMKIDPEDPEILVEIARKLMDVNDPDSAMIWLDEATKMDADSAGVVAGRMDIHAIKGQHEQGVALAREVLAAGAPVRQGARWLALWWLANDSVRTGNDHDFIEAVSTLYPALLADPPVTDAGSSGYASLVIRVHLAAGRKKEADALTAQLEADFQREDRLHSDQNLSDKVFLYTAMGDVDRALTELRKMEARKDFNAFWAFEIEFGLKALTSTTEYRQIKERVENQLAEQRKVIHEAGYHLLPTR